jgi:hypothetical protein
MGLLFRVDEKIRSAPPTWRNRLAPLNIHEQTAVCNT